MKNFKYRQSLICVVLFMFMAAIAFAQDPTTIVENAYQDILGRQADQAGLRNFRSKIIDQGWTEAQVRNALRNSPEFQKAGADIIIKRAYEDILNRAPDRGGMELYRKKIIEQHWSEAQVRDSLRQSQEYKNKHH
jgi:hypothetical protein